MKILVCHRVGGAWGYITDGFINALASAKFTVQRWDGLEASWRAFKPDLYIGCSTQQQPIPQNPECKLAFHVNPYGPINVPGINEQEHVIKWVINHKPDAVFGYGFKSDNTYWSYWTARHGLKWVPMPTAADAIVFKQTPIPQKYDIVYLGGRWPYKSHTIDKYLLPLLRCGKINYKLCGWGDWPSDINAAILEDKNVSSFLSSGKIGPCISELHTQQHGFDIPERVFKVPLCGLLAISDPVPNLTNNFTSAIIAKDPQEYVDLCVHYAKNDGQRQSLAAQQKLEVLSKHTYHVRLAGLLNELGFTKESQEIMEVRLV